MIEAYERTTVVPVFTESFGIQKTISLNAGQTATVLTNLETAHARRLDILIKQSALGAGNGIQSVRVVAFSAGRQISFAYQVNAAFATATHGIQVGEAYSAGTADYVLGDTIDIEVTNGAAANTIQIWAIARA